MLKQFVGSELKKQFSNMGIEYGTGDTNIIATIPPIHPSWAPIVLRDDHVEVTVFYGHFTHEHYKYYGEDMPADARAKAIAEEVVEELALVFDDQIAFWRKRHSSGMFPISSLEAHKLRHHGDTASATLWSGRELS